MTLESRTEDTAFTAEREGEKRPSTARAKAPEEASSAGALANSAKGQPTPTGASQESSVRDSNVLVRATCRIQLDLADLLTGEARDLHRQRKCGGVETCAACQAQKKLRDIRRDCARVANAALRLRWSADAELVDRYQLAYGRAPKGAEWEDFDLEPAIRRVAGMLPDGERAHLLERCLRESSNGKKQVYSYPLLCRLAPTVAAGIIAFVEQAVIQKWREVRFDALVRQEKSPPHYRYTNPIPLRKADVKLSALEGNRFLIEFSLSSKVAGRRGKEFALPIVARDDYLFQILNLLATDSARMGSLQLSEDRMRPGRWYLRIAYRKLADASSGTDKSAAINTGLIAFLAAITSSGETWIYDGDDIEAYLKQVQARRKRYQRQVIASARVGNGRTRVLRPIEHLSGKAERWRETRCQTIARRFVGWLAQRGIERLYIDDFSGIRDQPPEGLIRGQATWERIQEWPYYQLQMRISSCCEEVGIEVVRREPRNISGCCDGCGSRNVVFDKRMLVCRDCKRRRHWDIAAAAINLRDGERERRGEKIEKDAVSSTGKEMRKRGSRKVASKRADSKEKPGTGAGEP